MKMQCSKYHWLYCNSSRYESQECESIRMPLGERECAVTEDENKNTESGSLFHAGSVHKINSRNEVTLEHNGIETCCRAIAMFLLESEQHT